jgi:hypothetical protein
MECWKNGRLECWKDRLLEGFGKVEQWKSGGLRFGRKSYPSEGSLLLTLRYWIDGRLEKWEIGMLWLRNLF